MSKHQENNSSNGKHAETGAAAEAAGHSELTASLQESRVAIDKVIASARRLVRIFDRDLSDPGYRAAARVELLESFVLANRRNLVQIALHDARHLNRDCARLMELFRRHAHAFAIHHTLDAARHATDALVIADEHSFWHRLHQDQPRAVFGLGDGAGTAPLIHRFEEIWESSEPAVGATVLGL